MKNITLFLKQNLPFSSAPVCSELEPKRILCNDIVLPGESHPHGMRLWVIGNEYGAMGAVWANHEQDALDELVDADLGNGILIDEEAQKAMTQEEWDECAHLGNAGEPADLEHCWLAEVDFKPERDLAVLLKFTEARGGNYSTLDDL